MFCVVTLHGVLHSMLHVRRSQALIRPHAHKRFPSSLNPSSLNPSSLNPSSRTEALIHQEAKLLRMLDHAHIVSYADSFWNGPNELCLVMRYCDGIFLKTILKNSG